MRKLQQSRQNQFQAAHSCQAGHICLKTLWTFCSDIALLAHSPWWTCRNGQCKWRLME